MAKEKVTMTVQGMSCMHCVMTVKKAASSVKGVSDVAVDLPTGKVELTVEAGKTDLQKVKAAIEEAGYQVV
jgi:copper ion binding protein